MAGANQEKNEQEQDMTRNEPFDFLIRRLYPAAELPQTINDKRRVFRALVNVREPGPADDDFLKVQDKLL
jgi:hypothetical protein